jgi:hypothetical protein
VVILEAEDAIGTHTSSRNSEVIHAGIYYPQGSLKARACVEGKELLYEYCAVARRAAPAQRQADRRHRRRSQIAELEQIQRRAHANGVTDVTWMTRAQALALEPELSCVAALYSPSTGIVDSHALMLAYLGDAEAHGAMLALKSPLERTLVRPDGFELQVAGAEPVFSKVLVNSAGLKAPTLARRMEGYRAQLAPRELYAKGNYYSLSGRAPFSRLSIRCPSRAAWACTSPSTSPDRRASARTSNGSSASTTPSTRARRALLRRDPPLLAGAAGRRARPRLCRHPSEDRRPRRAGARLPSSRAPRARRAGAWCTSSASSRRDSQPASRWPNGRGRN